MKNMTINILLMGKDWERLHQEKKICLQQDSPPSRKCHTNINFPVSRGNFPKGEGNVKQLSDR